MTTGDQGNLNSEVKWKQFNKSYPLHFPLGLRTTALIQRTHSHGYWDLLVTVFHLEKYFRLNQNIQSSRFSSPLAVGFPI